MPIYMKYEPSAPTDTNTEGSNLSLPMVNRDLIAGNKNLDVKIDDPFGCKSTHADGKKEFTK